MILAIMIDNQIYDIDTPDDLIKDAEALYVKMDKDMDDGWQMSRQWVSDPNMEQRCQIVADKILEAFQNKNEKMVLLMSGYILSRLPTVKAIEIDTSGDITQTAINAE